MKMIEGGVCAAQGIKAAGVHCGIRANHEKKDLALIVSDVRASAAACYTTNKVYGAPITVDRLHIADGYAQAVVCNSGNANTCAPNGVELAENTCQIVADTLGLPVNDVFVASTGVIGQAMSIEPFEKGIPDAASKLAYGVEACHDAAAAIMTTDTHRKEIAVEFELGGKVCHLGGIAKGSGMINPNMATMLLFLSTDAAVAPEMLKKALSDVVKDTFNQISVDGDTSTNDTVFIMANGLAGNEMITGEGADYDVFYEGLYTCAAQLSRELAGDGEGCTKLLECEVLNAPTVEDARHISKSVISSSLFKAAMFGADANWGRILCAIGYCPGDFSADNINVWLESKAGKIFVCEHSAHHLYSEEEAAVILKEDEIHIIIDMNDGAASAKAWGCDLTYDYVKINGDYRT